LLTFYKVMLYLQILCQKAQFLNEDSVKGLITYVVDQLQDQLPHSDRTGLGQLLTSLVVEGELASCA